MINILTTLRTGKMPYALIFVITYGALIVGGLITRPALLDWYPTLVKPSLTPPNLVFPLVWNTLYLLLALATCRLWAKTQGQGIQVPLQWYGVQLVLNILWSTLHFGLHQIGWALVEIAVLWVLAIPFWITYRQRDRLASMLLLPYMAWLTFATYLNYSLWQLNP